MLRRTFATLLVVVFGLAALLVVNGVLAAPAPVVRANSIESPDACVTINSDITATTTWSGDCYRIITDTVTINPNVVLSIIPITTTRIEFAPKTSLVVQGNLQALGASDRPITFTSAVSQTACAWSGISFALNSPWRGNQIQYTTIEYACTGISIGGARYLKIYSNTIRYNSDPSQLDGGGGITAITDWTEIESNTFYSNSTGIKLNKSEQNTIANNTFRDHTRYGILLAQEVGTQGGSTNLIQNNEIVRSGLSGLQLEKGYANKVYSNSVYLNNNGAIFLSEQAATDVAYNHVYSNGGGVAYHGGIFITGTTSSPTIQHNVVLDINSDAVQIDAMASSGAIQYNALCAVSPPHFKVGNDGPNINAPRNWWGTNAPMPGIDYLNANVTDPITLSVMLGANRLPADASATTTVTVTLRDSLNNTVPKPNRSGDPNARLIALQTTLGSVNPLIVEVNDQGVATAVLNAIPQVGTGLITATAFCNYPITTTYEITTTNVAIAKTSLVTQTTPGSLVTYTLTYSNPSSIDAPHVVITDVLPAELNYVGDTGNVTPITNGNQIVWPIGPLAAGVVHSFTLSANVLEINTACGHVFTNTATIGTSALESDYTDNSRAAPSIKIICANLAITKTTSVSQVFAGSNVTYIITYSNSTAPAFNVAITDVLPVGMVYVGDTSGVTPITTGNQIVWPIGNLTSTVLNSFILTARVPANSANCRVFDPNNVAIGTPTIESTIVDNMASSTPINVICADWVLVKTADRSSGPPNEPIDYTITYTNRSPYPLSGAIITDALPANTSYLTDTSGILTWTLPTIPPTTTLSFGLRLKYTGSAISITLTNTACISSGLFDRDPNNNCSKADYRILSLVDVVVVKDDDVGPISLAQRAIGHKSIAYAEIKQAHELDQIAAHRTYVNPGELVTYTIAVVNVSAYTSTNFVLTETLPLYTDYVSAGWTLVGGRTYTQALGNLYPGTGRVLYFTVKVTDTVPSSVHNLINTICGFGSEYDLTPEDNCHIEDTPLKPQTSWPIYLPIILNQTTGPQVFFSSATYHVFENEPSALITVTLSKPWNEPITIDYTTEDGTATAGLDYIAKQGTIIFPPGKTIYTFTIPIIRDSLQEYWETVDLILSNPSANAKIGYPGVATLTIEDVHCVVPTQSLVSLYSPMDVEYDAPSDRLFIANRDGIAGGSVSVTHLSPIQHLANITGVLSAQGVALDTQRHKLYVVGWNWLNVLDSDTYSQTAKITLGSGVNAHAVVYNPVSQKIYVTGYDDNSITIIDANTLQIRARLTDSSQRTIYQPSYLAVNTNTGKVYVTNHAHGRPIGWVTVIGGSTDQIENIIYLSPAGELYGIAADNVHNRLYVASVNAAVVYAIDATTDTQLGYLHVRRWSDALPVPIRMVAVNPNPGLGSKIRLWLTSSSTEDNGLDNIISITGDWPNMDQPFLGVYLPPSPERGLRFDPTTKAVIVASASANRVTVLWDTPQTQQCLWPFIAPAGAVSGALSGPHRGGDLYTEVHDFSAK